MNTIPRQVLKVARLQDQEVVAWTTFDRSSTGELICQLFAPFLILSLVFFVVIVTCTDGWYVPGDPMLTLYLFLRMQVVPLAILFVVLAVIAYEVHQSHYVYWILTAHGLKIVTLGNCCCCGTSIQNIPLESITDCGLDGQGAGCCCNLFNISFLYIDTASYSYGRKKHHEAVGRGLVGAHEFLDQMMRQRAAVSGRGYQVPIPVGNLSTNVVGEGKTAQERLQEITSLRETGLITPQEYDEKRQSILALV